MISHSPLSRHVYHAKAFLSLAMIYIIAGNLSRSRQILQNALPPNHHASDLSFRALQSELLSVIAEKNAAADRAPPHRRHAREHNNTDGPQEAEVRRVRQRRE